MSRLRLWPERGPLVVAVSGGLDSVALVHVLARLGAALGAKLTIAHANHGLRPEADREARFVADLAGQLHLPFMTERLPVRAESAQSRESVEMTARRLRHAFLARAANEFGAGRIALAHHAGDQAELFLLRLLRGAGGSGLGGMEPCSPSPADGRLELIRPLLGAAKELIRDYAGAFHLAHCEDASNADLSIPRNRIRHELLPLLRRSYSSGIDSILLRTAQLLGADADFVRDRARRWLAAGRRSAFARQPVAVQRAIVREQLWSLGHEADFDLVERLRLHPGQRSVGPERGVRLRDGKLEDVSAGQLQFHPEEQTESIRNKRGKAEMGSVSLSWSRQPTPGVVPSRSVAGQEVFDAATLGTEIVLRHWRRGDRFRSLGSSRPTKLQDQLVNRKVPAGIRRQLIVATTRDGEIFWVEGLPPGDRFKVTAETSATWVLTWKRRPQTVPAGSGITGREEVGRRKSAPR